MMPRDDKDRMMKQKGNEQVCSTEPTTTMSEGAVERVRGGGSHGA